MKILRAYKTELDPTNVQATLFAKNAGCARWAYNWGLDQKKKAYEAGEKIPSAIDLHKQLVFLKQTKVPWMYEVSKHSPQEALRNLDKAFNRFFKSKVGYPRYKSKSRGTDRFTLYVVTKVTNSAIKLPRIGFVKLKQHSYLPTTQTIKQATISHRANRWFVSVLVEEDLPAWTGQKDDHSIVGVDLGIKTLAVVSDGQTFLNPKPLKRYTAKLRRLQRRASRKVKGSNNRKKANAKVAKQHYRVACVRNDHLHKITTLLTRTKSAVVIEDLNVSGMMKNHRLAQAIGDTSPGEFRRQLEYKGVKHNCKIVVADRFFPSSKRCSGCGQIKSDLSLDKREWSCYDCNATHDRDHNASQNLEWYGTTYLYQNKDTVGSTEIVVTNVTTYACGEEGSGRRLRDGETTLRRSKNETGRKHDRKYSRTNRLLGYYDGMLYRVKIK